MRSQAFCENFVAFYDLSGKPLRLISGGCARGDAAGKSFLELFDPMSRAKAATFWENLILSGAAFDWALHLYSPQGPPRAVRICAAAAGDDVLIVAVPASAGGPHESYDHLSGIINELSVAHRDAAQKAKLLRLAVEAERKSLEQAHISELRLQFLARSAAACARHIADVDALVREALSESLSVLGPYVGIQFQGALGAPVARVLHDAGEVQEMTVRGAENAVASAIAQRANRVLSVPLLLRNDRLGDVYFGREEPEYTEEERLSAEQFANIMSVALDNAMRYETERSVSEQLQRASLPEAFPVSDRFDIGAVYIATSEGPRFIGGDWYDAFELPSGEIALSVGDVTGHGIRAATTMAKIRSAVRVAALNTRNLGDPIHVLGSIHQFLFFENVFASAIYGRLDLTQMQLIYAIAGHPPPLLVRDGEAFFLPGGGTPLGLQIGDAAQPELRTAQLRPGDRLTFYTDGLVESRRDLLEGLRRLIEIASHCARSDTSASAFVDALVKGMLDGAQPLDDVAVLQVHLR